MSTRMRFALDRSRLFDAATSASPWIARGCSTPQRWILGTVAACMALGACSREEPKVLPGVDFRQVALEFARSLAARDYAKAHAMTSDAYRKRTTVDQLRAAFEAIVPPDWGAMGPVEVGETMTSWPDRQPADLGWAYVNIGGDVYSEAVTVVVAAENGAARIRQVEFGRP